MKFSLNPSDTTFVLRAETVLDSYDPFDALGWQGDIMPLWDGAEKAVKTKL